MKKYVLAVESSCDETAAALVDEDGAVLASELVSQIAVHNLYGGVVPEVASRAHFREIDLVVQTVLQKSQIPLENIHAIAATMGPGLIGPLLVGVSYARGLSLSWNKPFVGVHHLRGHLASIFLDRGLVQKSLKTQLVEIAPAVVLLASGGHTQILRLDKNFEARNLADTADDAAGECFDKSAKLMGLPYPGGPALETLAKLSSGGARARELAAALPRPRSEKGFSFSGLKTAIRLKLSADVSLVRDPDFCWAIQETIAEVFARGLKTTFKTLRAEDLESRTLVFCGGVSANQRLRALFAEIADKQKMTLVLPPLRYCTDNAAMIAAAAWLQSPEQHLSEVEARIPL